MSKETTIPFVATHPGELIKDELHARRMTQKDLCALTGMLPSVLSETVNGKRSISLGMAVALEKGLDIPAQVWMNMQTQHRKTNRVTRSAVRAAVTRKEYPREDVYGDIDEMFRALG